MPEISDEEYKEYIALKRRDVERREAIEKTIKHGVMAIRKWRSDLKTPRGYATIFANVLNEEWKRRNYPESFVLDRWKVVKNYLSPVIYIKGGKHIIRHTFRRYIREYGWLLRVDRTYGLFEVTKLI